MDLCRQKRLPIDWLAHTLKGSSSSQKEAYVPMTSSRIKNTPQNILRDVLHVTDLGIRTDYLTIALAHWETLSGYTVY